MEADARVPLLHRVPDADAGAELDVVRAANARDVGHQVEQAELERAEQALAVPVGHQVVLGAEQHRNRMHVRVESERVRVRVVLEADAGRRAQLRHHRVLADDQQAAADSVHVAVVADREGEVAVHADPELLLLAAAGDRRGPARAVGARRAGETEENGHRGHRQFLHFDLLLERDAAHRALLRSLGWLFRQYGHLQCALNARKCSGNRSPRPLSHPALRARYRARVGLAFVTHPDCLLHEMGEDHPERPERLRAIEDRLISARPDYVPSRYHAPPAPRAQPPPVPEPDYVAAIHRLSPDAGLLQIDPDTAMNPHTLQAALRAAGAAVLA